jgi:hypothetical protein
VNEALIDAESWRGRARSAPVGDLSAWAEALASAREARDLLRGANVGADLRRRVEEALAGITEERDGSQVDIPGCLASTRRYRAPGIVPPPEMELRAFEGDDAWPVPDYSDFTILRQSIYTDMSHWKPIPPGTTPATAGRCEPAIGTRVIDLIRKANVSRDNSRIRFQYRTEGFGYDLRCPGRRYQVRGSLGREQLGGNTKPVLIREIDVDLSDVPPGQEVRVVIHSTGWNGYQYNADQKQWNAILALDNLSEAEIALRFPKGRKPTTPPILYVFPKGSSRKEEPAHLQYFDNPLDQDWWVWRPRDILKNHVYQMEWDWAPDRAG